ncbi:MAG: ROK family protein, partial [Enterobacteriaceae bacterium]
MMQGDTTPIGNIELVKQLNSALVYRLIDMRGPISRSQIAEIGQLAPASITKITRQLLDRGLIKELEQQISTGGRRAISIICETRAFQAVAVHLGRHDITITLYNLQCDVLAQQHIAHDEETQQALEQCLLDNIDQFIRQHKDKISELIAIAVTLPGLIDSNSGNIKYMPTVEIEDEWPLVQNMEAHFKRKCFVGHDIRSLALAEHYFGATRDCSDSLLVRVHRGIGAGIIINNDIVISSQGNAGEIGHIQVEPLGSPCHCGNFGCLETIAANSAIEQRALRLLSQGHSSILRKEQCDIISICNAANQGDRLACELLEQVGYQLGKAIAIS